MPWDTCYQAKVTNPEQKTVGVDTDLLIYVTAGNFNEVGKKDLYKYTRKKHVKKLKKKQIY